MFSAEIRMHTCDFRQEALGGLKRLSLATGPPDLLNIMASALKPFGAEFFCINFSPDPSQKFEDVLLAHRLPADWLQLYLEKKFSSVDPSLRHCRNTTQPFEYSESPCDPDNEPQAAEVMQLADDFGVSNGFLVPIAGPTGCEGNVWIGGEHLRLTAREKSIVHLLSLYVFESVRQLTGRSETRKPSITLREREVLTWIAAGKTAWEIGEILHISKRTVDEHTTKAARKLNAANRVQAVAHAIRYRLIDP
jgi:LuxR family transcriptional regulator, quorum-sensing system regulator BjaR1